MSRFLSARLAALETYTPGEQPQDRSYVKLNTNESPFPPDAAVCDAVAAEAERLNLYPDPTGLALKEALAARYGVAAENVFLSNGSDDILNFAFMAFCDAEHGAAAPAVSYGFYPVFAALHGVSLTPIPLRADFTVDPALFCAAEGMAVLANPNAPTGLALSAAEIESIAASQADRVVLVDEAYVDFGGESCVPLTKKYENLLVVQTYSKSRSMAGARLGFAIGSRALIRDLEILQYSTNPYNINRMTMAAGLAALENDGYYMNHCRRIMRIRDESKAALRALGFTVTDSLANFLFASPPAGTGEALYLGLKERGVLVRYFGTAGIEDYVRITVGDEEQMARLLSAAADYLKEAGYETK